MSTLVYFSYEKIILFFRAGKIITYWNKKAIGPRPFREERVII